MRLSYINSAIMVGKYIIPGGVGEIGFTFRPAVFTSEFLDKLVNPATTTQETAEMLADALGSIDLTGDDDKPLTITGDVLYKQVPFSIVMGLINAMQEAQTPGKKSKQPSSSSFSDEEAEED